MRPQHICIQWKVPIAPFKQANWIRQALRGIYQLCRSSNQVGMEITKHERNFCQFHLTNPTRPGHCQSALAIPETTIDKKRPGTVVCGYRKIPATDRLTGFATAAPRTPERTRVTGRARLLAFDGAEGTPSDSVAAHCHDAHRL